jgi:NACalpha-BTF3-like transcription factor
VLSYIEFVVREHEENDAHMNDLYDVALISNRSDSRRNAIMEAMAAFGGD